MKNTILYVSFDVVPAPKGAATHIRHFVCALAEAYENVTLVTVSPGEDIEEGDSFGSTIKHLKLPALGPDLIARVAHFRRLLMSFLNGKFFDIIHFRSLLKATGWPQRNLSFAVLWCLKSTACPP